jgi:hypothetical protein
LAAISGQAEEDLVAFFTFIIFSCTLERKFYFSKKSMLKQLLVITALVTFFCKPSAMAQVALHFNGVNNTVQTSGSPVLNNQSRTVDAWINTTYTPTTQIVICDWGAFSPLGSRFTLNVTTNRLRIEVGGVGITGNSLVNTGQWLHVTAVYESSITTSNNVFLYINGVLDAAGTFTGYPVLTTTNTTGFRIGARVDGISLFSGAIDEVKIYNYARTAAQIAADTVEYCAPIPGLVAYYKLNEGVPNAINTGSTNAVDYSGNGNNGTLSTFTLSGTSSNWVPGRVRQNAPLISASPGTLICAGTPVTLSVNTSNSFTWSTGNTSSQTIAVSPSTSTIYSLSVTNNQNCVAFSTLAVSVSNGLPTLTITTSPNPQCLGAPAILTASGALTYSWTGGVSNGQAFTPSLSGTYSVTAVNGCGTVSAVRTLTVNPLPVSVLASSNSLCQGTSATLTASAAANAYTWMPGALSNSVILASPLVNTNYTVTASDGTCRGTTTVQINTIISPTVTLPSASALICQGQTYTVQASSSAANSSFTWLPSGGNNSTGTLSPQSTTAYSVLSTNSLGCTGNAQIVMVVTAQPPLTIAASKTLVCAGQSVTLTASGAGTYTWNNGPAGASATVTPPAPGDIYSVTASAASNTCTATKTIAILVFSPTVTATSAATVCAGQSFTLSAAGASTYSWNGSAAPGGTVLITPTLTADYTLTTLSTSLTTSCGTSQIASITVAGLPLVIASASPTMVCKSYPTILIANGATSYTWSALNQTAQQVTLTPIGNTTYTVTGTGSDGCVNTATVNVKVVLCPGFEEFQGLAATRIYPNPAKDYLTIDSQELLHFEILDQTGRSILQLEGVEGRQDVSLEALPAGLYFMVLRKDKQQHIRKLLVDQ